MRKFLLAMTALCALASPASAVMHGCLQGTACTEATIGGDKVTPTNTVQNFGFFSSPTRSGDLELKFLIPDNFSLAAVQAFASAVTVTGTSSASMSLFSTTPWTSGKLESDYLGITSFGNGAPPNPLDAWLGATQTIQPTATGYYVLLADMGQYNNIPTPGGTLPDVFSLDPAVYASGGLIVANLFTGPNHTLDVTTAQSGALFFSGPSTGQFCTNCDAVGAPGPTVGAGLPGIVAFLLLGLWALRRRDLWGPASNLANA